jgi:hypothetical protein
MTEALKPYRAYKDSCVPWLGEVSADSHLSSSQTTVRGKKVRTAQLQVQKVR